MPAPDILTRRIGHIVQPVTKIVHNPCVTFDFGGEGTRAVPPVFREPIPQSLVHYARYDASPLGHVLAKVCAGTFAYPLKITSCGELVSFDINHGLDRVNPDVVMSFSRDGKLPPSVYSYEDAMEMQYWQVGFLVTLFLNLRNGDDLATQVLLLEFSSDAESVIFHEAMPALMNNAHLLQWDVWQGDRRKDASSTAISFLKNMSSVPYHSFPVRSYAG